MCVRAWQRVAKKCIARRKLFHEASRGKLEKEFLPILLEQIWREKNALGGKVFSRGERFLFSSYPRNIFFFTNYRVATRREWFKLCTITLSLLGQILIQAWFRSRDQLVPVVTPISPPRSRGSIRNKISLALTRKLEKPIKYDLPSRVFLWVSRGSPAAILYSLYQRMT